MIAAAIMCLALNVYHESRGEPLVGQQAVALVTMNRAGWDPKRVCKEVNRPGQFSWTADENIVGTKPQERTAWKRAKQIAEDAIHGRLVDFTGGATYFHAKGVHPSWKRRAKYVMTLGGHHFYKPVS